MLDEPPLSPAEQHAASISLLGAAIHHVAGRHPQDRELLRMQAEALIAALQA